ncbi:hypothetical protein AB7102_10730 [Providencia manganoxydans]|uniref:hypothetical protein n=1 Tax=Providencia manganoxydans TaxID=2923283 RepID=UPI0034E4887E
MSNVTFICSKCQKQGAVESDDFDTEEEASNDSMGVRKEYWTEIELDCENPKCGNTIKIIINRTEYPEGDFQEPEVDSYSGAYGIKI